MIVTEWTKSCLRLMRDHRRGINVLEKYDPNLVGAVDLAIWRHRTARKLRGFRSPGLVL